MTELMVQRQIPPARKGLFYAGMLLGVLGFLTFLSTFISGVANFGNFNDFNQRAQSSMTRALIGMGMLFAGGILMNIGRAGLAGSGLELDPEKARTDMEPWSRMAGGVVKDALDEAGIKPGSAQADAALSFDERLRRLQSLRKDGVISEAEYVAAKKKILDGA